MSASIYHVDPERDLIYAMEFMRVPVGHQSPGLQRVLHVFRGEPLAGKYVLVCTKPHKEWQLARLSGKRGKPPTLENKFYSNLEEAERDVFRRRWKDFTGVELKRGSSVVELRLTPGWVVHREGAGIEARETLESWAKQIEAFLTSR